MWEQINVNPCVFTCQMYILYSTVVILTHSRTFSCLALCVLMHWKWKHGWWLVRAQPQATCLLLMVVNHSKGPLQILSLQAHKTLLRPTSLQAGVYGHIADITIFSSSLTIGFPTVDCDICDICALLLGERSQKQVDELATELFMSLRRDA